MDIKIETMTVAEATEKMRAMGIKISAETLRDGIEQKVYPFGDFVCKRTGGKVYTIYTKLFDEWVKARIA